MVSERVRSAESDIDDRIRRLPVWKGRKTAILRRLMNVWRDGLELAYMRFGHAAMFQNNESFEVATAIDCGMKWKLSQYGDCPLVQIGSNTYAISSVIKTLASVDDYMLRVAVLIDRQQYDSVSGLREERMVARCRSAYEAMGWSLQPHFRLSDPEREIDVYAAKSSQEHGVCQCRQFMGDPVEGKPG